MNIFGRNIRPDVKKVVAVVNSGGDPKNIPFTEFSFANNGQTGRNGQMFCYLRMLHTARFPSLFCRCESKC